MSDANGETRDVRTVLTDLYWAAVRAVAPGPALRAALDRLSDDFARKRVWIIAVGKAANPMAAAAIERLAASGREPAGGVIVAPAELPSPHASLACTVGDHPIPGARSLAAAGAIADVVAKVRADDEVWVLLSGGATSLMAAPAEELSPDELVELFTLLLGSGLDIAAMNAIRKRFTRWSAGRLAAALAPAQVRNFIISDVIGDDVAAIGSGPCVPDPTTATQLRELLETAQLWDRLPPAMRSYLETVARDPTSETPKAGDAAFATLERRIVASNRIALDAAAARARQLGYEPLILGSALAGEASDVGTRLAASLLSYCGSSNGALTGRTGRTCLIWGGETTVTLREHDRGLGGRSQELALSAARELARAPHARGVALLAGGTDGRDGPTDAAGAIVDADTWDAIRSAGRDPERDLAHHDSYAALDAAHALLRTGLTATNVMDIVIGIC